MSERDERWGPYPMRIQALPGSEAEHLHYRASKQYNDEFMEREALAPGVSPSPVDDLLFRGGKVIPQMGLQNIYLGSSGDFAPGTWKPSTTPRLA